MLKYSFRIMLILLSLFSINLQGAQLTKEDKAVAVNENIIGIGLVLKWENPHFLVAEIVNNSSAQEDGTIAVGDEIIAVKSEENSDWIKAKGLTLEQVVNLIRGPEDTIVWLKLKRFDEEYQLSLIRKPIKSE